jgi:hypothetical protein
MPFFYHFFINCTKSEDEPKQNLSANLTLLANSLQPVKNKHNISP